MKELRFDRRFVVLSVLLLILAIGGNLFLGFDGLLRNAFIALAIATFVLAPLPNGTRGLVFAVMIGLATGIASVNLFAVQIFQAPVTREFGWSQTQYTGVILVGTIITVISSPLIGWVFDRHGVRPFAIGSTILFGLALISLYFLTPNLLHFYGVFALIPLIGAGTSSVAYARVVARWFDARRGQALGAALAGIGIGGAVLSALTQGLIQSVGWRGAYLGLGLLLLLVTLPLLLLFLRDSPEEVGLGVDGEVVGTTHARVVSTPYGYSMSEVFRLPRFWAMVAAFMLLAVAIGGVMLQLVPIMLARGVSATQAAAFPAVLGLALIVGRAFAGFLMDRYFAPYVAAIILLFPIMGVALLASGAVGASALVGAAFLGLAAGAELDVIAYLVARYFGTISYARIYGFLYAAWTLGSGSAPVVTSRVYDATGSHSLILWVYVGLFALSAVMIARLGAYPQLPGAPLPERRDADPVRV
ncbi:MAG: MFS transporter [Steroidobacteraceae bacterium]|nr:MFS transporter [Steroidobacteraceae bacterium]